MAQTVKPVVNVKTAKILKSNGSVPFLSASNRKMLTGSAAAKFSIARGGEFSRRKESNESQSVENGRYCTKVLVSAEKGDYDRVVLGNQNDKIYPGAIFYDNAVTNGTYNAPTDLALQPYDITTDLFSAASSGSSTIRVEPAVGSVYDGIAELMRRNSNVKAPSRVAVDVELLGSMEQLAFEVGAGFTGYGVDMDADFSYMKRTNKNVFIAKLTQVYFSVHLNQQRGTALIPNATAMPNLLFVNKVNYGRLGYIMIASDSSKEAIEAALNFAYESGNTRVTANARLQYEKLISSLNVKGFFFGGNAANTIRLTSSNQLGSFDDYVQNGLTLDPNVAPVAVSYELKYMNDNASAATNSIVSYWEQNCTAAKGIAIQLHNVAIDEIHGGDCSYAWGKVDVELWETNDAKQPIKMISGKSIWSVDKNSPERNVINFKDIKENRKSAEEVLRETPNGRWSVMLDPKLVADNKVMVKIKMNVNTNHKDNDLAVLGFHGMNRTETVERMLPDVFASADMIQRNQAKYKYGTFKAGPFCSNTDRSHCFYSIFTITNL
ncbi:MAG: thiol-activated cytolysin family protein [Ferruginibacter sp.]